MSTKIEWPEIHADVPDYLRQFVSAMREWVDIHTDQTRHQWKGDGTGRWRTKDGTILAFLDVDLDHLERFPSVLTCFSAERFDCPLQAFRHVEHVRETVGEAYRLKNYLDDTVGRIPAATEERR